MQRDESHDKALAIFWSMRKSSASLYQWLKHVRYPNTAKNHDIIIVITRSFTYNQVIDNSIKPDLENILDAVKTKKKELRSERLRLLKEKMAIHGITDINLLDDCKYH